jgi:hypothetical protein
MGHGERSKKVKPTIDQEVAALDILADEEITMEKTDALAKWFEETTLGAALGRDGHRHAHNLAVESAPLNASVAARYKKIAEAARVKQPAAAGDDPHRLQKRFSADEKAGYRQFFKEHLEKGKTAAEILNGWLAEFPHHHPDIGKLMREVAAEFA